MGQETSQLAATEGHDATTGLRTKSAKSSGQDQNASWVPINQDGQEQASDSQPVNGRKRKRSSKAAGGLSDTGQNAGEKVKSGGVQETTQPPTRKSARSANAARKETKSLQVGLGITTVAASTSAAKGSLAAPVNAVILSTSRAAAHKSLPSKQKVGATATNDSDGDDETQARGLLEQFQDDDSDEDELAAGSPANAKTLPTTYPSQPHPSQSAHPLQRPPPQPQRQSYQGTPSAPNGVTPHRYPQQANGQLLQRPDGHEDNGPFTALEQEQLRDEGRFTKMEQSFLKDAIDEYCRSRGFSVELANDFVCGKARQGNIPADFWDEICKALPQRTKNSIQRAAKRVFRNNQKKGQWTEDEEKALSEAYAKTPDQWARICEEIPGRSAEQCRDRWRNYTQNGVQLTRGPWTDQEESQFVAICKDMLGRARAEREQQRRAGRIVSENFDMLDHLNFTSISTMMQGSRSRLHCRNKWHKLKKRPDIMSEIERASWAYVNGTAPAPSPFTAPPQQQVRFAPNGQQVPPGAPLHLPAQHSNQFTPNAPLAQPSTMPAISVAQVISPSVEPTQAGTATSHQPIPLPAKPGPKPGTYTASGMIRDSLSSTQNAQPPQPDNPNTQLNDHSQQHAPQSHETSSASHINESAFTQASGPQLGHVAQMVPSNLAHSTNPTPTHLASEAPSSVLLPMPTTSTHPSSTMHTSQLPPLMNAASVLACAVSQEESANLPSVAHALSKDQATALAPNVDSLPTQPVPQTQMAPPGDPLSAHSTLSGRSPVNLYPPSQQSTATLPLTSPATSSALHADIVTGDAEDRNPKSAMNANHPKTKSNGFDSSIDDATITAANRPAEKQVNTQATASKARSVPSSPTSSLSGKGGATSDSSPSRKSKRPKFSH